MFNPVANTYQWCVCGRVSFLIIQALLTYRGREIEVGQRKGSNITEASDCVVFTLLIHQPVTCVLSSSHSPSSVCVFSCLYISLISSFPSWLPFHPLFNLHAVSLELFYVAFILSSFASLPIAWNAVGMTQCHCGFVFDCTGIRQANIHIWHI